MPHIEFEKNIIHKAVREFLENEYGAKVFPRVFIPCNEYPKPVRSVGLDLLGITDRHSILVECKVLVTPYMVGLGLGELLLYWNLLKEKKTAVEEKIGIPIIEPIVPYLSVCSLYHPDNEGRYKWTHWDEKYVELFHRLKRDFRNFNPGLLLVKRRAGVSKPASQLKKEDIRVEVVNDI